MRFATGALCLLIICTAASPTLALRRQTSTHPFFNRGAISGYFGAGVPVGEFSSEKDGDGNHEGPAFDWSAELEYFFGPGVSVGVNLSHTRYQDKTFSDLMTNVNIFGAYLRYVVDTPGPVFPYLRFGVGSMEIEFEDDFTRVEADHSGSVHVGGGGIVMLGDYVSVNGQVLYTFGFTDDAIVNELIEVDGEQVYPNVGFDTQYWTFAAGVSLYFP